MTPHFLRVFIISNLFRTADKTCEGNNYFENVQYQVNTYRRTIMNIYLISLNLYCNMKLESILIHLFQFIRVKFNNNIVKV